MNELYVNRSELYKQFPELAGRERAALSMRIVNRGCLRDPFANLLIAKGAIPEQVGSVSAFHESCGDSGWGIDVHTRRPHYVFFQIENIGNDVAILDRVILKKYINMDIFPSDDGWLTVTMAAIDGRNLAIRPSETLTIFLGIICGPLDFDSLSYTYVDSEELGQNSDDQETVEKLSYTVDGVKEDFVLLVCYR